MAAGVIPEIPIYLDSPMALDITRVYAANWRSPGLFRGQDQLAFNPFATAENKMLRLVTSQEESDKLARSDGPYIVVTSSGMCDYGRVLNHLQCGLENPNATVCLIGYMAKGSLGWKLKQGWSKVTIDDREITVRAHVAVSESFSAHADKPFLTAYTGMVADKNSPNFKKVFIVHGEEKSAQSLKQGLISDLGMAEKNIIIPKKDEIYYL
jgi:metallo-beta-lactamase family protein